jgi:hypothetical protein
MENAMISCCQSQYVIANGLSFYDTQPLPAGRLVLVTMKERHGVFRLNADLAGLHIAYHRCRTRNSVEKKSVQNNRTKDTAKRCYLNVRRLPPHDSAGRALRSESVERIHVQTRALRTMSRATRGTFLLTMKMVYESKRITRVVVCWCLPGVC